MKKLLLLAAMAMIVACEKEETQTTNTVKDIDGNNYEVVQIGNQYWTAENLKTSRYNNGDYIERITDVLEYEQAETGAYIVKGGEYFYNYYTLENVCPTGWKVPNIDDWHELIQFIAGDGWEYYEGFVLKSTSGWFEDGNGNDHYGFNGLPVGAVTFGEYSGETRNATFWVHDASLIGRMLSFGVLGVMTRFAYEKSQGYSVRCIKN